MLCNLVEIMRDVPRDPFEYLLCADFEATCWDGEGRYQELKQEIIEFPVILVHLNSGDILGTFREFVRPVEHPKLMDFCMKLTGISQEIADSGILLAECIERFKVWLKDMITQHSLVLPKTKLGHLMGNTVFCSWGNWDCTQIQRECHRKRIPEASCFDQWMDVKRFFTAHYDLEKQMLQCMQHVGLAFEGHPHTGLDDARNLARLVTKMRADGVVFRITRDNVPHLDLNEPF